MLTYAARRALGAVPRVLLVSVLLFLLVQLPEGGPADVFAADPSASPEAIAQIEALWGLDRPLHEQYLSWAGNLVRGDWGASFSQRRPARDVVLERLGNTLWLTGGALLVGIVFGVLLGIAMTFARQRVVRSALQLLSVLGMSVPTFWSGTLVLLVFAVQLDWIPSGGMRTIGAEPNFLDMAWHLLAPALVLGSVYVAQWSRFVYAGLEEVYREDFLRTARAKGIAPQWLLLKHAFPATAIPLVTVLGLELPRLMAGAMVTEVVFAWPGIGRLLTDSLLGRDYPVVMASLMILVILVIVANLITDLMYGLLDPRVRYE